MRTVKVLTVKQPWAYLLIAGLKDVENRNWPTNYRGELYIHASVEKSFDWGAILWMSQQQFPKEMIQSVFNHFGLRPDPFDGKMSRITAAKDEFGAIVGSVTLDYCTKNSISPWAMPNSKYHWLVSNAKPITPIPARGMLGLWNYNMSEEGDIKHG